MDHLQDRWLSIKEICAYLGVSDDTVYRWIKIHEMPTHNMGRDWMCRTYFGLYPCFVYRMFYHTMIMRRR